MSRGLPSFGGLAFVLGALVLACTTESLTTGPLCTASQTVYCRCQDRQEGQKTCASDGNSYGACIPCETADNPEVPFDPSTPVSATHTDAGSDAAVVANNGDGPCGDGIVNTGEDCDVLDAVASDGCNSSCQLSGITPAATMACPGLDVHLWRDGRMPAIASTTSGGGQHRTTVACGANATTGATGTDRVFNVAIHTSGTLRVAVTNASFDAFVWAAASCEDEVAALACANATDTAGGETLSMPVVGGRAYHVFVDGTGASNNAGTFLVTFSLL